MDRNFLWIEWLPSQTQFVNPALILTGIPLFTYVIYPFVNRFFNLTPLRKIGIGFVLTAMSFGVAALIEQRITAGHTPNIGWQFLAYAILTSGEIMVSIVCLEFAYTQSPPKMKSFIMGVFFLGIAIGNYIAMGVNFYLKSVTDRTGVSPLEGAKYYWFFAGAMIVTTIAFVIWSQFYKGKVYIQGESAERAIESEAQAEGTESR